MNLIQEAREKDELEETHDALFKVKDAGCDGDAWLDLREDGLKFYAYTVDAEPKRNVEEPQSVKTLRRKKAAEECAKLNQF